MSSPIDYEKLFRQGRLQVDNLEVPDHRQLALNFLRFFAQTPEAASLRRTYPSITDEEMETGVAVHPVAPVEAPEKPKDAVETPEAVSVPVVPEDAPEVPKKVKKKASPTK